MFGWRSFVCSFFEPATRTVITLSQMTYFHRVLVLLSCCRFESIQSVLRSRFQVTFEVTSIEHRRASIAQRSLTILRMFVSLSRSGNCTCLSLLGNQTFMFFIAFDALRHAWAWSVLKKCFSLADQLELFWRDICMKYFEVFGTIMNASNFKFEQKRLRRETVTDKSPRQVCATHSQRLLSRNRIVIESFTCNRHVVFSYLLENEILCVWMYLKSNSEYDVIETPDLIVEFYHVKFDLWQIKVGREELDLFG